MPNASFSQAQNFRESYASTLRDISKLGTAALERFLMGTGMIYMMKGNRITRSMFYGLAIDHHSLINLK